MRKPNSTSEELTHFHVPLLDMNRFKRHLKSLLDRACRMAAQPADAKTASNDDEQADNDTIHEDAGEEQSDWVSNDKRPVENLLF